jgi:hypothetical protein
MSFDFLANNNNSEDLKPGDPGDGSAPIKERGGKITIGKNVFYDQYESHFDAHNLFSTPPLESEFKLRGNYRVARTSFGRQRLDERISSNNWFGPGTTYEKLVDGYTTFINPTLLNDTINEIQENIPNSLFSRLEKPKMKINDRFGMFSYDLASMAMTYVFEYFTIKGNKKIDANFVFKKNGKFFDFNTKKEVKQQIKRRKNGTPVVISSVRKCLIDFEKKDKNERAVEIIINASFNANEVAEDLIYNAMAGISVAQNLILKGFKVKVTGLMVAVQGGKAYYHFVPVKRYNQPLDINAAAYVCGDPRFDRYQGFKMFIYGYDQDNFETDSGLGSALTNTFRIEQTIEKDYVPNSRLKQADTRLYFGGSRNIAMTKLEVAEAIKLLNDKYAENEN